MTEAEEPAPRRLGDDYRAGPDPFSRRGAVEPVQIKSVVRRLRSAAREARDRQQQR